MRFLPCQARARWIGEERPGIPIQASASEKVFLHTLIRTMEIAKKSYELARSYEIAQPCKSKFLTKKSFFYSEF